MKALISAMVIAVSITCYAEPEQNGIRIEDAITWRRCKAIREKATADAIEDNKQKAIIRMRTGCQNPKPKPIDSTPAVKATFKTVLQPRKYDAANTYAPKKLALSEPRRYSSACCPTRKYLLTM